MSTCILTIHNNITDNGMLADKAAQAPTKRRKLLVPGISQTTQVQSTSNQTNMTTAAAVIAYKDAVHLAKIPDQTKCTQPISGNIQQPDQHGKGITAAPTSTSGNYWFLFQFKSSCTQC